jgi:hypothetical protein
LIVRLTALTKEIRGLVQGVVARSLTHDVAAASILLAFLLPTLTDVNTFSH